MPNRRVQPWLPRRSGALSCSAEGASLERGCPAAAQGRHCPATPPCFSAFCITLFMMLKAPESGSGLCAVPASSGLLTPTSEPYSSLSLVLGKALGMFFIEANNSWALSTFLPTRQLIQCWTAASLTPFCY